MAAVSDGVYQISFPGRQLLTLQDGSPESGTPIILLEPVDQSGTQDWEVQSAEAGTYTIRNLASKTYLGFDGRPVVNGTTGGFPDPQLWQLTPGAVPGTFTINVPGSDVCLGQAMLRIHPPRTALSPSLGDVSPAWIFEGVGQP